MSTSEAHIRYDENLLDFLKTYVIGGNTTDTKLFSAINKGSNGKTPYTTLKSAFSTNKDKLTINIVKWLFVFVLNKETEYKKELRETLLSLNKLLARLSWEDLDKKNKDEIVAILNKNSSYGFVFFEENNANLLLINGHLTKSNNKLILSYKGQKIILDNLIEELFIIKKKAQYKEATRKEYVSENICSYIQTYPEREQHILPHFIGREFVFDVIDKFLTNNKKGYFFLKADAGIGKTSFAIKLVNERGYPFHMINAQKNNTGNSVKDFIKNICAQLICEKRLSVKEFPKNYDDDGDFLLSVLRMVSEKLKENEKFVIVVDGLDELKQEELTLFKRESILYLPEYLPPNIFFLLTMRNIDSEKGFKGIKLPTNHKAFTIESKGEDNIKDAEKYIKESFKNEGIQEYLKKHKTSQDEFVEKLKDKSKGNFMYLYHILLEIDDGNYKDTKLNELPRGLEEYYQEHWNRMMAVSKEAQEIKLKTIYVLSNMESPVSVEYLTKVIKQDTETVNNQQIRQIINNWQQFLTEIYDEQDGRKKYTFYHKSFLDFLASDELVKTVGDDYSQIAKEVKANYQLSIADDILGDDD